MTYPTKEVALLLLQRWKDTHAELLVVGESVKALFGRDPGGTYFDSTWAAFDAYTDALAVALGAGDWLHWFSMENEMGAKAMQAGYHGKLREIKGLRDLLWVIERGRV